MPVYYYGVHLSGKFHDTRGPITNYDHGSEHDVIITFWDYFRVGARLTIITLVFSS